MEEWWTQTAEIKRAEPVGGVYGRANSIGTIDCSEITPTTQIDRLRAGQPDIVSLMMVYTAILTDEDERPKADDRLLLDGIDYRIRHVIAWPVTRAEMLEIFIEDEGLTY